MSNTGLEIFDTTLQETNHWLKIVMEELQTSDRRIAFGALRAGLHALRDRIGPVNAVHLAAQLPMLLRGAYYEGWQPGSGISRERHVEEFLRHVEVNLPQNSRVGPEAVARATFCVLAKCLDIGEVQKVFKLLPREMGVLWPDSWEEQYRTSRPN
jgi:uncharacterized protein (DUF2267 family)